MDHSNSGITLTVTIPEKKVTISKCYHECPYFSLDGGPSPVMYCGHPSLSGKGQEAAFIISHPDCDTGFPKKCPLLPPGYEAPKPVYSKQEQFVLALLKAINL